MAINILWDDLNIVTIEKIGKLFFSNVNVSNFMDAREKGFPTYFLEQISLVSDELSPIIKNRIPSENKLKFKGEKNIYEYVNETGCRRPTDKLSITIDFN